MHTFTSHFDEGSVLSVIVDVDARVAYAYLLVNGTAVSDVWLFNRIDAPQEPEWKTEMEPPYLNPLDSSGPLPNADQVQESDFRVMYKPDDSPRSAAIYFKGGLLAILKENERPGKSAFATKPSPVAFPLFPTS